MKVTSLILLLLTSAAVVVAQPALRDGSVENLAVAEKFVDAFYSFDRAPLQAILSSATEASRGKILFYQGWAEGGHYRVIKRSPCQAEWHAQSPLRTT